MPSPTCQFCSQPAVCFGAYEEPTRFGYSCNECCGHGNEDGWCHQLADEDNEPPEQMRPGYLRAAYEEGRRAGAAEEREACLAAVRTVESEPEHAGHDAAIGFDLGLCAAEVAILARNEAPNA